MARANRKNRNSMIEERIVTTATGSENNVSDLKTFEEANAIQKVQVNCGAVTTRGS